MTALLQVERNLLDLTNFLVTAVKVPTGWKWEELDAKLREEGVIFGGSYEKLSGVVFRIGHMGSQTTDTNLLEVALNKLQKILKPN